MKNHGCLRACRTDARGVLTRQETQLQVRHGCHLFQRGACMDNEHRRLNITSFNGGLESKAPKRKILPFQDMPKHGCMNRADVFEKHLCVQQFSKK